MLTASQEDKSLVLLMLNRSDACCEFENARLSYDTITFVLIQNNYSVLWFHCSLLVSYSGHAKESVGNLWLRLRPVCEKQEKVTAS